METAGRLTVDVPRLNREGERLKGETCPEALDLGDRAGLVEPVGGMVYDLRVQVLGHELLVRGRVSQKLRCTCRRCAAGFEAEVTDDAVIVAVPLGTDTEFVDLTPDLREAIILSLPDHPVCRSECRGLCAHCGANLNDGPCGCPTTSPAGLGGLEMLKLP